jgi:hypothetical protein
MEVVLDDDGKLSLNQLNIPLPEKNVNVKVFCTLS